ncbi:hypothetical protein OROGR_015854 [Orobanche gracilis]
MCVPSAVITSENMSTFVPLRKQGLLIILLLFPFFSLCRFLSGFMKVVGDLSILEELKVQNTNFLGEPEWEPSVVNFLDSSLRMLHLDLVHWKAHANHFPKLQQLIIIKCCAMMGLNVDLEDIQSMWINPILSS